MLHSVDTMYLDRCVMNTVYVLEYPVLVGYGGCACRQFACAEGPGQCCCSLHSYPREQPVYAGSTRKSLE
jgi:hypothetical protein